MGSLSIWHWLIFLVVVLLMFGGSGKISAIMGDVAKGIKSFRKGLSDDDDEAKKKQADAGTSGPAAVVAPNTIEGTATKPAEPTKSG
jgi:sec-independent protein translocase protein TatA